MNHWSPRPLTEADSPGVPSGWSRASLRELCSKTGFLDPVKSPELEFAYVDVSSVSAESLKVTGTANVKGVTAPSRARKLLRTGDVIFATVRPSLRRVAFVPPSLDGQLASTAFCVIRANPDVANPQFLYYAAMADGFVQGVGALERGASYPAVTDGDVLNQEILVPPLPEQNAIAGVLSKLQAAVEVQNRIVATLKDLKSATMAKLFREGLRRESGPPRMTPFGEVPAHWQDGQLSEYAEVQTGVAKGRKLGATTVVELPYLRVANVQDGYLDLSEIKTILLSEHEVQRYLLREGDVVLTEGGDFDKLGRGYLWSSQVPNCVHQNHIFAVRSDRRKLLPEFFAYQAQSAYGKSYFLSVAHKTTNLACINARKLRAFPLLIPEMAEQREIASRLRNADDALEVHKAKLRLLIAIFSRMLYLLMTGQVRVSGTADSRTP